jgi:phosphomannomutase
MKVTNLKKLPKKDLIVFDLDGTLAETKSIIDKEMVGLMNQLLATKKVAVIGGGKYGLFQIQLLKQLQIPRERFANLFLFPTTGTSFYRYQKGWKKVYALPLTKDEAKRTFKAFQDAMKKIGYKPPKKLYGALIENRGTQITWSALGQDVVDILGKKKGVALKNKWRDEHTDIKLAIAKEVAKLVPDLEVRAAGHTSIDVTRKGIDKAYGLKQMVKYLHVKIPKMLFIGDAIFPGGNDYAALKTGVDYVPVKGPEETKKVIRAIVVS